MRLGDFLAGSAAAAAVAGNDAPAERAPPPPSWTVRGTKKGGLPVQVETRKNGKVVVVISNVDGDLDALLTDVKRALGTGGVARPDGGYVEVQGRSHHERTVSDFLLRSGRLVGVNKGAILEATSSKTSAKNSKSSAGPRSRGSDGKAALNAKAAPQPTKPIAVETTDIPDAKKIKAMKPPELKAHLQARGLSTQGNKKELIARLLALKVS